MNVCQCVFVRPCFASLRRYDAGMSEINYGKPVFASMVVLFSVLGAPPFTPRSRKQCA
jgi:hypothetical protein